MNAVVRLVSSQTKRPGRYYASGFCSRSDVNERQGIPGYIECKTHLLKNLHCSKKLITEINTANHAVDSFQVAHVADLVESLFCPLIIVGCNGDRVSHP